MRILVVDDDPMVRKLLHRGLTAHGHVVDAVESGREGLDYAASGPYDVMVLDLTMPGLDGLEVARRLRLDGNSIPLLMLTSRDELDFRLAGFEVGADDYLTKPFSFQELLARLTAVARRRPPDNDGNRLRIDGLVLDRRAHLVTMEGEPVKLTPKEFAVLELLMEHPDQAFSRTIILERVWDYSFEGMSNVVDVTIRRLRRALGGGENSPIQTVHGVGYRIRAS